VKFGEAYADRYASAAGHPHSVAWPRGGTPPGAPDACVDTTAGCEAATVVVDGTGGIVVVDGAGAIVVEGSRAVVRSVAVVGGAVAGGVAVAVADGLGVDATDAPMRARPDTKTSVARAPRARHRRVGEEGMGELPPGGTRRGNSNFYPGCGGSHSLRSKFAGFVRLRGLVDNALRECPGQKFHFQ
jgi:hypothetical protein